MLWILFGLSIVACAPNKVETVQVPASSNCSAAESRTCISVTEEFIREHGRLFADNIRLKADNDACHGKGD
jgi:hypothetical protein